MAFCLVAAGAGFIGAASHLTAQGYLMRQADQQLRSYAGVLTSRPFTLFPGFPLAPGAASPGGPGRSVSIEVRDSGGQLLISAGSPLPPTRGGSWLKITEPIRYQARHIPFAYGAEDSSFHITGKTGTGPAGTLVVGLDLAGVGRAINRLTLTGLAVSGIALLLLACAAAGAVRVLLRPLKRMAATTAAVASGDLSRRMPVARARGDVGSLTRSLNQALDQAELALTTAAASEAAARESAERMRRAVADAGDRLRRPLSVLAGLAEAYRERGGLGPGDLDPTIRRMADEAARMDAVLENLLPNPASVDTGSRSRAGPVSRAERVGWLGGRKSLDRRGGTGQADPMVPDEERLRLRQTFDQAADTYQHARPDYPAKLFDTLIAAAGLAPGDRLLEVGCATGKATVPLARRGFRITCIELGAELAVAARRNLAGLSAEVVEGRFEDWQPAADERFDLVFAATAWHWVDPGVRYRAAWRALRPGGHLAFWGAMHVVPDGGDPFFREIQEVYDEIGEGMPSDYTWSRPGELTVHTGEIEASGLFQVTLVRHFDWERVYDAEGYIGLLDTFSGHIAMADWQRERLYAEIRRRLAQRPDGTLRRHWGAVLHVARRLDGPPETAEA